MEHDVPPSLTAMSLAMGSPGLSLIFFSLSLIFYHASEVLLVFFLEPEELDCSSLLLSPPYLLAMAFGLLEYFITWHFLPTLKQTLTLILLPPGIILAVSGEALRKAAWLTARASFTHRIQALRRPRHILITSGVYRWSRHPGYLGWLVWAVSTQILLANPLAILLFAAVSWNFFKNRIPVEEFHLVRIFGADYVRYRERTPTRIPGIA